jgi:hypothetical protein
MKGGRRAWKGGAGARPDNLGTALWPALKSTAGGGRVPGADLQAEAPPPPQPRASVEAVRARSSMACQLPAATSASVTIQLPPTQTTFGRDK